VPYERAVARAREKPRVDERAENGIARRFVEAPQAACLFGRQSKPRHLEKLSTNPSDDFLDSPARLPHPFPRWSA
jgi:hypothetical protein